MSLPFNLAELSRKMVAAVGGLSPNSDMRRLLSVNPPPLIHPDARLVVLFSPKSACTSVVIWFFHQLGIAKQAREYHQWPHRYRTEVHYGSALHRDACRLNLSGFKVLRVVRDPIDRAASSFRHALAYRLANKAFAELLGRTDIGKNGASFREFLDLLERLDLTACDSHYAVQRHPIERRLRVTHLINISTEDLFVRLNEVEAEIGLPVTDFAQLEWLHLVRQRIQERRSRYDGADDVTDAYETRLVREQALRGPWPSRKALLTPVARERIARLYAADIAAYGRAII
jgi:hypothetical protein